MSEAPLVIGYFWNDYGHGGIRDFIDSMRSVYPGAVLVNCARPCEERLAMAIRAFDYANLRRRMRGKMILLDTDIIAKKPVPTWDFDIGLTRTREATPLMPYNGGVILANDTRGATSFLDEVSRCCTILPADFGERMWYIDQLALGYAAKGRPGIEELPADYNYIPSSRDDVPESAYFVHYKGRKRKGWK